MPETETQQAADELHYRRAMRRIYLNSLWVSLAGTALTIWKMDWDWTLGFALGAAVSTLNFRWLHRLVDSIGPGRPKPGRGLTLWLSTRYLLFGLICYILVRYFTVDVLAVLVGLFVAVAAVLLEILYELIYVRT